MTVFKVLLNTTLTPLWVFKHDQVPSMLQQKTMLFCKSKQLYYYNANDFSYASSNYIATFIKHSLTIL